MSLIKKKRFQPKFRPLVKLRENILSKKKLLKFRKKKWERLQKYLKSKEKWFKRFKVIDHEIFFACREAIRPLSYKRRYNQNHIMYLKFKLFYGIRGKKAIKKLLRKINKAPNRKKFIKKMEMRLDAVLVRAKFCSSARQAGQLITHGRVKINNFVVQHKAHNLKFGDIVSILPEATSIIEWNLSQLHAHYWSNLLPLPPKYLYINYFTLQIFIGKTENKALNWGFPVFLDFERMTHDYKYM